MATQLGSRLLYNNAKALIEKAGYTANGAVLSQSFLRSEVAAATTTGSYRFPILVNDNFSTVFNTMNLLALQDAFVIGSIGIFLAKPASSTDTNYQLFTYLNATTFPTGTLNTIYNSKLTININNKTILPSWDVKRSYYVPTTQAQTAPYYAANTVAFKDEQHEQSGMSVMEPNVTLVGSRQNEVTLVLPASLTTVDANTRIILLMRGILAQNVTPVR